jgi:ribosomal protein S18 acetylase RimI-like enzyme
MILSSDAAALGLLWMMRLDGPLPEQPRLRIPAVFERVGAEQVEELSRAMGFDDLDPVLQRLGDGRHCYLARVEGRLAAYGWITFDREDIGELGLSIRLNEGEAYIWDCATLVAYRGQRLYPALLVYMLGELKRAGYLRIWIGTDADNLPSQKGVALVGCQRVVDIIMAEDGEYATRGCPGVVQQDVLDAHYALFGNRDVSRIILPD